MSKPSWFLDFSTKPCLIVAGGPSVARYFRDKKLDLSSFEGRFNILAVNAAMRYVPQADAYYAADARWWETYADLRDLPNLKVTTDKNLHRIYPQLEVVELSSYSDEGEEATQFVFDRPGVVAHGGNSGHQAINLAIQFGAIQIALLGFDMNGRHWHEDHPLPLRNPKQTSLDKWARRLDSMRDILAAKNIRVVNLSKDSALQNYKKVDNADDALAALGSADAPAPRADDGAPGSGGESIVGGEVSPDSEGPAEGPGNPVHADGDSQAAA